MSKKAIYWIISLMSISLLGIIAFQAYWIQLSIKQKAEEFDRDVYQALANVSDQIEKEEVFVFINQMGLEQSNSRIDTVIESKSGSKLEIITDIEMQENEDSLLKSIKKRFQFLGKNESRGGMIIMDESSEDVQILNLNDSSNKKVKLIKRFKEKKSKLTNAINQMAVEFAFRKSDLAERLKGVPIDSLIGTALYDQGITNIPYQYAILSTSQDSLILGDNNIASSHNNYRRRIFENDEFQSAGELSLSIPNKTSYVLNSLWLMLSVSLILTLVMIYTFSYTIYSIIKQKRISTIKSDFINNMTHEFKTPIATISLAIDSIMHPEVKKQEKEIDRFGAIIKKENARMNDQVERVLQMAMFEKQEIQFEFETVDVHQIINELVENFSVNQSSSASIECELIAEKTLVCADSMHLYNALRNILDNGVKFSGKSYQLEVKTINSDGEIIISISDRGIGMTKETQKRIFDRFFRLSQGNIHQTKGFGLGLAYVKEVVEKLNGRIEVESQAGKGSTFTIFLPLLKDEAKS